MSEKAYTTYKLRFISPLHIGNNRDDYGSSLQTLASDSFYAAMTATLAKIGEPVPANGDLGCIVSSLFPFYQKDEKSDSVLFFPIPLSAKMEMASHCDPTIAKKMKAVNWVDADIFENVLLGKIPVKDSCVQGQFLTRHAFPNTFIISDVVERVAVSRSFEDSRPFYMERIHFEGNSGLFFLAEGDTSIIDKALPLLSIEGIGTDRNVGNGQFVFEKNTITLALPEQTDYGVSMSVFIPENKEQLYSFLSSNSTSYELIRRGGWITTPPYLSLRKNAIYGFAPGSIFYGVSDGAGKIVDLAPSGIVTHPIWRCGKSLFLPIRLNNGNKYSD